MYIFPDRDDLGHVYIFSKRAGLIDPQLIGDRFGELYKFSAHPTVDDLDEEQEALETAVAPRVQSRDPMEERESLLSTGRRLSQHERTNAQEWGFDSPRSSGFKVWLPEGCLQIRVQFRLYHWFQVQKELLQ